MGWVTADGLRPKLADLIKVEPTAPEVTPGGVWETVLVDAVSGARADIQSVLYSRGYSRQQLESWPDLEAVHSDQALYWCCIRGAAIHPIEEKVMLELDRREWLLTAVVTDAAGDPAVVGSASDRVGFGPIKASPSDTFLDQSGKFRPW